MHLTDLLNIKELEEHFEEFPNPTGVLFCFGTSFISKLIQAKTRKTATEIVPSHVALICDGHIYESTTGVEKVGHKTIKAGVRRWTLEDFIKAEHQKQTEYAFLHIKNIDRDVADSYIHLPYGKDTILDFLLKDGSDGDSHGLICSQYANIVTQMVNKKCPNPAEMYRKAQELNQ